MKQKNWVFINDFISSTFETNFGTLQGCTPVTNLGKVRGQDHTNNEQTQSVDGHDRWLYKQYRSLLTTLYTFNTIM